MNFQSTRIAAALLCFIASTTATNSFRPERYYKCRFKDCKEYVDKEVHVLKFGLDDEKKVNIIFAPLDEVYTGYEDNVMYCRGHLIKCKEIMIKRRQMKSKSYADIETLKKEIKQRQKRLEKLNLQADGIKASGEQVFVHTYIREIKTLKKQIKYYNKQRHSKLKLQADIETLEKEIALLNPKLGVEREKITATNEKITAMIDEIKKLENDITRSPSAIVKIRKLGKEINCLEFNLGKNKAERASQNERNEILHKICREFENRCKVVGFGVRHGRQQDNAIHLD